MGVYANLLAQLKSFEATDQLGRWLTAQIAARPDPAASAAASATDAVDTISQDTVSTTGADFTLTFTLRSGETFTTSAIAFNASAATIEGAIDTAATSASIAGWTNGDISVSGTDLQTTDIVITFDGTSVAGLAHNLTTMTDSRTGGTPASPLTVATTRGQSARGGWDVLLAHGVISGSIPEQDAAVTTVTVGADLLRTPALIVRMAATEATYEDDNQNSYYTIMNSIWPNDRAPSVEQINAATA